VDPIAVAAADDPRIADYMTLTDPELRKRVEHDGNFFIAEGLLVVRRLLETDHRVRSVLVVPSQLDELAEALENVDAPVYVVEPRVMRRTVGFDLHRGVVAAAERYPLPALPAVLDGAHRIAVLERVNDHENLGGLFRNAAAFGVDGVLLDPQCSDPLYRRSVRVSIGNVLTVPWTRAEPWPAALDTVAERGFRLFALTPAADATPIDAVEVTRDDRIALLLGAEGPGLSADVLARVPERIRIPMAAGVDSLNVAVAAAVAFHHFRR
jgi:tRNA G18 (ribose-2'-O)-methylase SpoU